MLKNAGHLRIMSTPYNVVILAFPSCLMVLIIAGRGCEDSASPHLALRLFVYFANAKSHHTEYDVEPCLHPADEEIVRSFVTTVLPHFLLQR